MLSLKGTVSKIRIIQFSACPLVYFKLDDTNCLICSHSLSFLSEASNGRQIVIAGDYNAHKQFVCRKYSVIGKPQVVLEVEQSHYPSRSKQDGKK